MKALTLYQPYASAIPLDLKHWETRSWKTHYRGPLAIHASASIPQWAYDFAKSEMILGRIPKGLPMGQIVALVDLTEILPAEESIFDTTAIERLYGDYSPGRYAWKLENVRALAQPVPARGRQGLWTPSAELEAQIMEQIELVASVRSNTCLLALVRLPWPC